MHRDVTVLQVEKLKNHALDITLLTESIRNALSPDLVALPIKDAMEELQTFAVWTPDVPNARYAMTAPKDSFIHYLKHTAPIEKFTA